MHRLPFPGGARFAFTIFDDTDVATVENVRPVYRLLEELGMRTTKTVWPLACPEGSRNFSSSQTLEDPEYLEFVLDLRERGFEITWHAATMESSARERTLAALEAFRETFGNYPRIHANHALNLESIYWGSARVDHPLLRAAERWKERERRGRYYGEVENSPHWWGDLCARHIEYGRNLTFNELNLLKVNPSMPYHDPSRPLVRWWFSATDAEDCAEMNHLLREERVDRFVDEGGLCVIATHLGKEFAPDGRLDVSFRRRMERLARLGGWFPTVGELLDWLRERRGTGELPHDEWRRMQWRWFSDLVVRKSARLWRPAADRVRVHG